MADVKRLLGLAVDLPVIVVLVLIDRVLCQVVRALTEYETDS